MTTWIALLRGINVSGQKNVPMAELRALHEGLGHADVVTYIQSGNVVFDADATDPPALARSIEEAVSSEFGFEVPVVVRTAAELTAAAAASPHTAAGVDPRRVAVVFLREVPDAERIAGFDPEAHHPDVGVLAGREVHLWCPSGFGRTKLTNAYLERRLGVVATTRNWRTVQKLADLATRT